MCTCAYVHNKSINDNKHDEEYIIWFHLIKIALKLQPHIKPHTLHALHFNSRWRRKMNKKEITAPETSETYVFTAQCHLSYTLFELSLNFKTDHSQIIIYEWNELKLTHSNNILCTFEKSKILQHFRWKIYNGRTYKQIRFQFLFSFPFQQLVLC